MDDMENLPELIGEATLVVPNSNVSASTNGFTSNVKDDKSRTSGETEILNVFLNSCEENDSETDESDIDCDSMNSSLIEQFEDSECLKEAFRGSQTAICLICDISKPDPESVFAHMKEAHQFDFIRACVFYKLDQIGFIKLVNYLRRNKVSVHSVNDFSFDVSAIDEIYMKPVLTDDSVLTFDLESHLQELGRTGELSHNELSSVIESNALKDLTAENEQLKLTITRLQALLHEKAQQMLDSSMFTKIESVCDVKDDEDSDYFESYDNLEIHHEMLRDQVRTESYRNALIHNPSVVGNASVLDVGCGTGILSVFSAIAGACKVTAIDNSSVAHTAVEIVILNNQMHKIKVIKGRIEDQSFEDKFDIIVSEWMGYFLLFEGMVDSVLYARDRFLKAGGTMLPTRCTLHLIALDDAELQKHFVTFWSDVYGIDMSCIAKKFRQSALTINAKADSVATSSAKIADFDMATMTSADTRFTSEFQMTVLRNTDLTAFCGYFDTYFDLPNPSWFSTAPHSTPTHWKQTVFLLPKPVHATEGEILNGVIAIDRMKDDVRALCVNLTVKGKTDKLYYKIC